MTLTEAIFQGILQGLTEFLPVSSSGHLAVYQYFTGQSGEAGALFSVLLHLGTLLAVIIAFWGTIWELVLEFFRILGEFFCRGRRFPHSPEHRRMIGMLLLSLLPLGLTFVVKDLLRHVAEDQNIVIEGLCFLVTAVLLLLADRSFPGRKTAEQMRPGEALLIGTVQAIAPLPGVSRSGSTLSAAMLCGFSKEFAIRFSFLMGIPAVCGALLLDAKDIFGGGLSLPLPVLLAGLGCSLVFGLLAIGMVRWLVASDRLRWFGYYTLVVGVICIIVGGIDLFTDYSIQKAVMALLS